MKHSPHLTVITTAVLVNLLAACSSPATSHKNVPERTLLAPPQSKLDQPDIENSLSDAAVSATNDAAATVANPAVQEIATVLSMEQEHSWSATDAAVQSRASKLASSAAPRRHAAVIPQATLLMPEPGYQQPANRENYQQLASNPVVRVADNSTSTFSIDVDTGSYSNVRRFLNSGQLPPADAVRLEEMLNYFSYDYPLPDSQQLPFELYTELATTPWNSKTRLLHIGVQGFDIDKADRPAANLVFLIDVSGSMTSDDKLGLLKASIRMLVKSLTKQDRVSLVVYAGASGVALEPTAGDDYSAISAALDMLQAGGSTNGQAGIELAYSVAERNLDPKGINRIMLATDGDFNVGISDIDKLKSLITEKRESGIALSTLGFGTGNYNDYLMEQLADTGNGTYAYIDTLNEARKVLSDQLSATLMTIASDVKIQVEFNQALVSEYRLLGYVNRKLANEDFNNDRVDAGEVGAGHSVTALYEISLHGEGGEYHSQQRYTTTRPGSQSGTDWVAEATSELAEIRVRYKNDINAASKLITKVVTEHDITSDIESTSNGYRHAAAVAGFAQLLRGSKYTASLNYNEIAQLAAASRGQDEFAYRSGFLQLVRLADSLASPR